MSIAMVKVPVINQPLQEWPGELEMYRVPGTSNRQRAALKMGKADREAQITERWDNRISTYAGRPVTSVGAPRRHS